MSEDANKILNLTLHGLLGNQFGSVLQANAGEGALRGPETMRDGSVRNGFRHPGEYYRVNCPYCNDTRHRLWVHHLWGVPDDQNDCRWWSANCYNEECLSVSENLANLRHRIYSSLGREQRRAIPIAEGEMCTAEALFHVADPGRLIDLRELPDYHPANLYLSQRGFDTTVLARDYGVALCDQAHPEVPMAANRLICPIVMRGEQVSWQARYVGEADWHQHSKYYNCPRTNKRLMLYGMDDARTLPFVILVEGVTDVWKLGAGAVALMGKNMSHQQMGIIEHMWRKVVLLLDEDALESARDIAERLRNKGLQVVLAMLPPGVDPAEAALDYLWDLIYGAATAQGVDLLEEVSV